MKTINLLTGIALLLTTNCLKSSAQAKFLDIGDKVDIYPTVTWIRGTPLNQLDKDKTYLIELWATWCKPCIAAMPHLSELHQKFGDKIVFVGQDVWEEDIEKVRAFLAKNDKLMNFTVAYAGPQATSDFDKKLIKPTGTSGIPRTLVIQNNTLIWITDPTQLTEKTLQLIVDRKFTVAAAEDALKKN